MSAGVSLGEQWDNMGTELAGRLTLSEGLKDSPEFRQAVAQAEIIVSQIKAYYNLTQESCRQAITTGEAFASSLSRLAGCINLGLTSKQSYPVLNGSSECNNSNINDTCIAATHQLLKFAEATNSLSVKFTDLEKIFLKSDAYLSRLFELRANFLQASEDLEAATSRAAAANCSRPSAELMVLDERVKEAQNFYRTAAANYLTSLRSAVTTNHLSVYLRTLITTLNTEHSYLEQVNQIFNPNSESLPNSSAILGRLKKQTNMIETHDNDTAMTDEHIERELSELKRDQNTTGNRSQYYKLQGYLFKRSGRKGWRSWARRWFQLSDNRLVYCKRVAQLSSSDLVSAYDISLMEFKDTLDNAPVTSYTPTTDRSCDITIPISNPSLRRLYIQATPDWRVMEPDLRVCTARICYAKNPHSHSYSKTVNQGIQLSSSSSSLNPLSTTTDRRFSFELIAPGNRIHYLQASNLPDMETWVSALRSGLSNFQQNNSSCMSPMLEVSSPVSRDLDSHLTNHYPKNYSNSTSASESNCFVNGQALLPSSQPSIPDYDALRSQSGILLWREPDIASNRQCADCTADNASWASINLGVTLCTQCASAHRGLGVHISKVRSLTLDNWEPELLHVMLNLGNRFVNQIFEANLPDHEAEYPRPSGKCSGEQRLHWIKAKWVRCQFARLPLPYGQSSQNELRLTTQWIHNLYESWSKMRHQAQCNCPQLISQSKKGRRLSNIQKRAREKHERILNELCDALVRIHESTNRSESRSIKRRSVALQTPYQQAAGAAILCAGARIGCPLLMLAALAGGASPDGLVNSKNQNLLPTWCDYPPLILAVQKGSLAACEFLLLNGADIDIRDKYGQTPLHHASQFQRVHIVCLLLRRRANQSVRDKKGQLPLDIAVNVQNADIVTLLRLQQLSEVTRESDQNLTDETVTDVFRDFTSRTYYLDCDEETDDGHTVATTTTLIYDQSNIRHSTSSPSLVFTLPNSPTEISNVSASNPNTPHRVLIIRKMFENDQPPIQTSDNRRRLNSPQHRTLSPQTSQNKNSPNNANPKSLTIRYAPG